jgi:hypothetical protein
MNRRNFLSMMVGGIATAAAVRTFPFRVYSFPKEIALAWDDVANYKSPIWVESETFLRLIASRQAHPISKRAFRVDVLERMVRGYGLYNPDGNTWS